MERCGQGSDATAPQSGPAAENVDRERAAAAPEQNPNGSLWGPGDAPTQVLEWAIMAMAKAGPLSVIGVYPPTLESFPIGLAMNRNVIINMGNCNHRKYVPRLVEMVRTGMVAPETVLTRHEGITSVLDAYKAFDQREPSWLKVVLAA